MISNTQVINKKIESKSTITNEKIISKLIQEHASEVLKMQKGLDYYNVNNTEINKKSPVWFDENLKASADITAPNHQIKHGWHRLLVNQKTAYLVGRSPTFSTGVDKDLEDHVNEILDEDFDDDLNELVKGASNKGKEFLHVFINKDGEFDYVVISALNIIPIYDTSRQKDLEAIIHYYPITINDETRIRAEFWDDQYVTYYVQDEDGEFKLDTSTLTNEPKESHFYYNELGYGWGKVPFIEFPNNNEKRSDLDFYKSLVDDYDLVVSSLSDDIERIQQAIYVLKGYDGESLAEFTQALRIFKAVKVSEDGGVDKISFDIPIAAKDSHLDRLEENIFLFGEGVNMKTDRFGNSPSGVALRFMYALLDGKASILERKFKKSMKQLFWFVVEYINMVNGKSFDYKDVGITFNKSMISNDKEIVEILEKSPYLSEESKLEHHPFVVDVQEEINRFKTQDD